MPSELGAAALDYAQRNLCSVFRLTPRDKIPLPREHESAEAGELIATRDPQLIEDWWKRTPDANIGAALRFGPLFVLDIDPRSGGDHWMRDLLPVDEALSTLVCETGSGGGSRHYWFVRPQRLTGLACKGLATGVDIKGIMKGYVVLPPSIHPSGKSYEWYDFADPFETDIALAPDWLVAQVLMHSQMLTRSGKVVDCAAPDDFVRGKELLDSGWPVGRKVGPGKWLTVCPNQAQHTDRGRRRVDSSTVLMAPSTPAGRGRIFCSHGHCEHVR